MTNMHFRGKADIEKCEREMGCDTETHKSTTKGIFCGGIT